MMLRIRQLGRRRSTVAPVPFTLPHTPATLRQLLSLMARQCAAAYHERARRGEAALRPMTEETLAELEAVGRLTFGIVYGGRQADEESAVSNALQAFQDGLYRVFHGDTELTSLDAPLSLREGDEITLLRLTMLTGSLL